MAAAAIGDDFDDDALAAAAAAVEMDAAHAATIQSGQIDDRATLIALNTSEDGDAADLTYGEDAAEVDELAMLAAAVEHDDAEEAAASQASSSAAAAAASSNKENNRPRAASSFVARTAPPAAAVVAAKPASAPIRPPAAAWASSSSAASAASSAAANAASKFAPYAPASMSHVAPTRVDDFTEKHSGFRVRNRLVSSVDLDRRLSEIKLIPLKGVPAHIAKLDAAGKGSAAASGGGGGSTKPAAGEDWATMAVLTFVSDAKPSARGSKMSWWKLNDLSGNEMTLFLFGKAFEQHWKVPVGSLVCVANPAWKGTAVGSAPGASAAGGGGGGGGNSTPSPGILSSYVAQKAEAAAHRTSTGGWTLSIAHPELVLVIGPCMDMGTCKAMIADKSRSCRNFVNTNREEYCAYHLPRVLKQRYDAAMATRMDLNQKPPGPSRGAAARRKDGAGPALTAAQRSAAASELFKNSKTGLGAIRKQVAANPLPSRAALAATKAASTPLAVSTALMKAKQQSDKEAREREIRRLARLQNPDHRLAVITNQLGNTPAAKKMAELYRASYEMKRKADEKRGISPAATAAAIAASAGVSGGAFAGSATGASTNVIENSKFFHRLLNAKDQSAAITKSQSTSTADRPNSSAEIIRRYSSDGPFTSPPAASNPNSSSKKTPSPPTLAAAASSSSSSSAAAASGARGSNARVVPRLSSTGPSIGRRASNSGSGGYSRGGGGDDDGLDYGDYGDESTLSFDDDADGNEGGDGRSRFRMSSGSAGPAPAPLSSLFSRTPSRTTAALQAEQKHAATPQFVDKTAAAKARALRMLGGSGVLAAPDPNSTADATLIRSGATSGGGGEVAVAREAAPSADAVAAARKRKLDAAFGKVDVNSEAGRKLLAAESRNVALVERDKQQRREGLFGLLEKREDAAAAVDSVTKIETRVHKCAQCKTTTEFMGEICKRDRHTVTRHMATKRFFECTNCHNKTTTLDSKIPYTSCAQCGKVDSWNRTSMHKKTVKAPALPREQLQESADEVSRWL